MAQNSLRNLREQLSAVFPDLSLPPDPSLPCNWEERTFLKYIYDADLRRFTANAFPIIGEAKTLSSSDTHPVFLLKRISNIGFTFCPCTSKSYNSRSSSCIPAGTPLLPPGLGKTMDKDSYILDQYLFSLTKETCFADSHNFFGIVPEEAIQGDAYKRRLSR